MKGEEVEEGAEKTFICQISSCSRRTCQPFPSVPWGRVLSFESSSSCSFSSPRPPPCRHPLPSCPRLKYKHKHKNIRKRLERDWKETGKGGVGGRTCSGVLIHCHGGLGELSVEPVGLPLDPQLLGAVALLGDHLLSPLPPVRLLVLPVKVSQPVGVLLILLKVLLVLCKRVERCLSFPNSDWGNKGNNGPWGQ